MSMIATKCTQCGSNVHVESSRNDAFCEFCGTNFIVGLVEKGSEDFQVRAGTLVRYNGASTRVVIPDTVIVIGAKAFMDCAAMTAVSLPNGIQAIGSSAFENCISLTDVALPDGVRSIGNSAFKGCTSLVRIVLPGSLTTIANQAFANCTSLQSINIPDSLYSFISQGDVYRYKDSPFYGAGILSVDASPGIMSLLHEKRYGVHPSRGHLLGGTPYGLAMEKNIENQRQEWRSQRRCCYCGGKVGFWSGKCKNCGAELPKAAVEMARRLSVFF